MFPKHSIPYPLAAFTASLKLVDNYHNSQILTDATVDLFRVEVNICKPSLLFEEEERLRGRDRTLDHRGRALKGKKSVSPEKQECEGKDRSRSPTRSPQRSNSPVKAQQYELFSPTSKHSTRRQMLDLEASFDSIDVDKVLSNCLEEEEVLKLTTLGGVNDTALLCLTKERLWELGVEQADLVDELLKGTPSS